jgi:hypothetical protein
VTHSGDKSQIIGMVVRHRKRGTRYTVVCTATLQTNAPVSDDASLVIYRDDDGKTWARPVGEFLDGRFDIIDRSGE